MILSKWKLLPNKNVTTNLIIQRLYFYGFYSRADEKKLICKKGTSGIHIIKTSQTFICSMYQEPTVPEQCASATEKLGDYLIGVGF